MPTPAKASTIVPTPCGSSATAYSSPFSQTCWARCVLGHGPGLTVARPMGLALPRKGCATLAERTAFGYVFHRHVTSPWHPEGHRHCESTSVESMQVGGRHIARGAGDDDLSGDGSEE